MAQKAENILMAIKKWLLCADEQLQAKTEEFRENQAAAGESLMICCTKFLLSAEAAKRIPKSFLFHVQIMGDCSPLEW